METSSNDILHHSPPTSCNDVGNHESPVPPDVSNQGDHLRGLEYKHEIGEEARTILEVIAATGKFWHDWDKLKSLLSFQLMQVLSEYPEAKMTGEQQSASLGETYPDLAKRLDEALLRFVEGPPFTLQRLCEILLSSRSIYPNLSKLALALEKNLLVTSTLTISADPYPPSLKPEEIDKRGEELQENAISEQNGLQQLTLDKDEVMTEVEEADVGDEMTMDVEAFEQIVGSSEPDSAPSTESSSTVV